MDALRRNDYFVGKTEAKLKNGIKDCLHWTLGFKQFALGLHFAYMISQRYGIARS